MAAPTEYYQQMQQMANQPVQNVLQQRAEVKDALDSGMKMADLQDKTQESDSNSEVSKAARNIIKTSFPSIAQQPGFENMSYSTIKGMAPVVENILTNQTRQIDTQIRSDAMKASQADRGDYKQQQAYNQTIQQLEQMRGSPAVAQAEKDLYSAAKAQTLMGMGANSDPNNLSNQQVNLLVSEVGKIAQGGVPNMDELKALTPGTLQGKLAGVWSKLTNDPTPANAGAFIKQYQDYTMGLAKDAQKVIEDRYGRVINARKSQFTPAEQNFLDMNYIHRFDQPSDANTPQVVRMKDPQGNIRMIPEDQVDAAKKAGGTVVGQ
jgi:hypothetical protein